MEGMFLNLSPKLTYSVEKKDETGSIQFTHVIEVDETVEDNACMLSPSYEDNNILLPDLSVSAAYSFGTILHPICLKAECF